MINARITTKVEGARLVSSCNIWDLEEYYEENLISMRKNIGIKTSTTSFKTGQSYQVHKSKTEKILDKWEKKKVDKKNFDMP